MLFICSVKSCQYSDLDFWQNQHLGSAHSASCPCHCPINQINQYSCSSATVSQCSLHSWKSGRKKHMKKIFSNDVWVIWYISVSKLLNCANLQTYRPLSHLCLSLAPLSGQKAWVLNTLVKVVAQIVLHIYESIKERSEHTVIMRCLTMGSCWLHKYISLKIINMV